MNCDRIASFYRLLETLAFGRRLQRHRLTFLTAAEGKQRVLILGDGDGRFTQALAANYPDLKIDSIELSAGMVAEARKRADGRATIMQGDALQFRFSPSAYDLIFTHFFLDCFSNADLDKLLAHVPEALTPNAPWVLSDFRQAPRGWRRPYTRFWLLVMYWFFKWATGLKTQRLPDYERALAAAGFHQHREEVSADGLIVSQRWERLRAPPDDPVHRSESALP